MEYIRCHEVEQILNKYPDMKIMAENIRSQMRNVLDTSDIGDEIESMALKRSTAEDIAYSYTPGTISDRTAKIALGYQIALSNEKKEALRELRGELLTFETIINKLDIGISILSALQKDIIIARCWDALKWAEVIDKINKTEYILSATPAKAKYKLALDRLCIVSRITIIEYQTIMKLFYLEDEGSDSN